MVALVLLAACLGYLLLGPKPWETGIAAAELAAAAVDEDTEAEFETSHYRVSGMWWGALANAFLCLLVLACSRWLTHPLADPKRVGFHFAIEEGRTSTLAARARPWIIGSVLVSILITLTGTLPRMDNGLWHDEDKSVRRFIIGQFLRSKSSGEIKYREVTWEEAVWNNRTPNHTLYGILARVSHQVFPRDPDPAQPFVNEWSLRLPALLGGLGGLALLAAALASLGFHRAAAIAPLLLSVHPWFLRYSSEARGYSLLFLLLPLCVWLLVKALQSARWKWWVLLGIAEFLTVYAVLNGAHFLVIFNLAALVWIFTSPGRGILVRRWLITCAVAMLLGIQLMGAFLPQFKNYVESTRGDSGQFDSNMIRDKVCSFATGIRYQDFGENYAPSYKNMIEGEAPIRAGLLTLAVLGLSVVAALRLWRSGMRGVALLGVCLLPAPFFFIHALLTHAHIFYWYTIVGLPFFWALVAIGAGRLLRGRPMPYTAAMGGSLALLLFWASYEQRRFQIERPIEYTRESVYATRDILDPRDPRYDAALSINISRHPMVYDGAAHTAKNEAEFLGWLEIADETGRPLFLNYGAKDHLRKNAPKLLKYIEDPALFKLEKQYYGVDPGTDRTVKKYVPGSYVKP